MGQKWDKNGTILQRLFFFSNAYSPSPIANSRATLALWSMNGICATQKPERTVQVQFKCSWMSLPLLFVLPILLPPPKHILYTYNMMHVCRLRPNNVTDRQSVFVYIDYITKIYITINQYYILRALCGCFFDGCFCVLCGVLWFALFDGGWWLVCSSTSCGIHLTCLSMKTTFTINFLFLVTPGT
jgi:hypothetical protein